MRSEREHGEQAALIYWCNLHSKKHPALSKIYAIPNGGHRHPAVAMKLKAEGVKAGIPDLFLPVPTKTHSGLFIEMKYGNGKPTDAQKDWLEYLNNAGYWTCVCYSWKEAAEKICQYLLLQPREMGL